MLALAPDLLFASRIRSLVGSATGSLRLARSDAEFKQALAEQLPRLALIDLNARGVDGAAAVRLAKAAGVPRVVVFGPHRALGLRAAALEAGADRWVTNQRLSEALADELSAW